MLTEADAKGIRAPVADERLAFGCDPLSKFDQMLFKILVDDADGLFRLLLKTFEESQR